MVKKKTNVSTLKYGLRHLTKYKGRLLIAIFWSVFFILIPMQLPLIFGTVIDGLTISGNNKPILFYGVIEVGRTPNQVIFFGLVSLIIVAIGFGVSSFLKISISAIISRNFVFELQRELIRKLEFLSLDIHKKHGSGGLLNNIIVDTNNVRPFVEVSIIKSITNAFRISYPLIMLFIIDPLLALVTCSILPIQFLIIRSIQYKITNVLKKQRTDKARLITLLKENLDGIETIITSNAEKYSIEKITNQIGKIEDSQVKSQKYYALMMGFAWGLTAVGIALAWWLGGLQVLGGDITLGQLVIFSGLLVFAYEPVRYFTRDLKNYRRSIIALKHVRGILETPSSIQEPENSPPLKILDGKIELRNVTFSFKKRNVLRNVDLTIESKKITAIVGKSGSGKSSILKLIARLYDPNEGQIFIDKQDIKNISVSSLRSQIAIVPQSPMIFDGTIMENIRLANPDASEAEVREASTKSDSLEFISKFKNGLNTLIGHGGITLSAGENQRIAIARALLKKAKILILDEPTTAVDIKSTHSIMDTLNRLKKDVTIVIVAHNISSTYGVDNTITIDDGVVVELFERTSVHNDLNTVTDYLYNPSHIEVFKEMSKESTKNIQLQTNTDNVQASNKFVDYQVIGTTPKKRRMDVVVIGKKIDPQLKIFVMAGQHGDEKLSRKAAEELVSHLIKNKGKEFPEVSIAVLSNANPDGVSNNRRVTSANIDMNRDHLLLGSGENRLIHSFIRSWKPNLIVDVHTYPPSREYLEQRNYVMHQDVLVDCPTNLGVRRRLELDKLEGLIKAIQSDLSPLKYICDRYVLVNPEGKTRHSTSDIVDARNFLSLRYDILTILVEGREPLPEEDQKTQIERTVLAEYHTLLSIIKWAVNNAPLFTNDSNLPPYSTGDRIAIRYKYDKPEKIYKMNLENKLTKKIEEVAFPSYQDSSKATRTVRMPYAYAIPSDKSRVINLLHRHGFKSQHGTESELFLIQKYFILASKYQEFRVKDKPRPPTGVRLISTEEEDNLSQYEIFLTSQEGGYSLPLFLEPQSEYGLPRYERLNLAVNPGDTYAIVRVIKKKETTKDMQDKETKVIQDKETTKDINPAESVNKSLSPIRR